ncbi:MAG: TIGR03118 family protein [Pseudomonadota bacterium]|nr:TIGR03118 family protein [Pseudomonadota bacterium]
MSGRSLFVTGASLVALALGAHGAAAEGYSVHPLVTDDQSVLATLPFGPAPTTDPALINPWDMTATPYRGWVVANAGGDGAGAPGTVTVYGSTGVIVRSTVSVPEASGPPYGPTGAVNVVGAGFKMPTGEPALYLFDNLDGSISGWDGESKTVTIVAGLNGGNLAVYTGLEVAGSGGSTHLYAVNGITGAIDVFDTGFHKVTLAGAFVDPGPNPDGLAPFNIENLDAGHLWITYATPGGGSSMAKLGQGFVSVFNTDGTFVRRFASGGTLSSPWGMAIAPANFGKFSNNVLIGNFNDGPTLGYISAFDPATGQFRGLLRQDGRQIILPGLWAMHVGSGAYAGQLFFTAGIGAEQHGLFGTIALAGSPN